MPFDLTHGAPQRIAIIGGGISGLAAARLLAPHHRVTLYEAEGRLGGHARTVMAGRAGNQPVDTGFIVFNKVNYPHLTEMFQALDVPIEKSEMSFGVSLLGGRLEYALRDGNALFGQRRNLLNPAFHAMIRDILRFNAGAETAAAAHPGLTIGELVEVMRLGRRFREQYLFPICGAIWSSPARGIGAFPAESLVRFMRNHALLSQSGQHQWWTVTGGSIAYVSRLEAWLRAAGVVIRTGAPMQSVLRQDGGVLVRPRGGVAEPHDQVIFATHADQTLRMLADATGAEGAALGAVQFRPNRAVLHRDPAAMPLRRRCWSAWVYRSGPSGDRDGAVGVTYWMNRLQNIPETDPLFISLNPDIPIRDEDIQDETVFRHPVFDSGALAAQDRIDALQGERHSWYAGAWMRNGFHEDGFASAVRIAQRLIPERV